MKRRHVLGLLGAAAIAPRAFAQRAARRIGYLGTVRGGSLDENLAPELARLGYRPGHDLVIDARFSADGVEGLRGAVREMLANRVEVIITGGTSPTLAAKAETTKVPIVALSVTDPVGTGMVDRLSRPLANITGISNRGEDLTIKRVELLRATAPIKRLGYFWNTTSEGNKRGLAVTRPAITAMGIELVELPIAGPADLEDALVRGTRAGLHAFHVPLDGLLSLKRHRFAQFGLSNRLPGAGALREFVDAGGLFSYGQDQLAMLRAAVAYVDRILKGAKVQDLPFQEADKIELGVNLATAKALSLDIPRDIRARADVVVER
jgi:putative ABC transport system substrate-binding protein